MPKAPASGRSSGHVTLSFGVLQIPLSLYAGTVSDHGIKRQRYVPAEDGDHQVGNQNYDKMTGDVVAYSEIVSKIQTEYGPVYVEDHEIEQLFQILPDSMVVKSFQPLHLFHQGHYVPKGLLYVEPRKTGSGAKKGPDPLASKALVTLFEGMRSKGACAVVELTTRGVPKPAILLPDGTLWLLHHTDALREQRDLPEVPVQEAEVKMMGTLIETLWSTEVMDLTDQRSALIQNLADEKAQAGDFAKPVEPDTSKAEAAPTQDLMAMLAASVEAAKGETETKGETA